MKTRIISILLAVCLIFGLLPVGVFAANPTSGTCGPNAKWSYDSSTKTLTISGSGTMDDYGHDWAGGNHKARPWAAYQEEIENVIICNGITSIGREAFGSTWGAGGDSNLRSVSIASTVTRIGAQAFAWTKELEAIDLPDGLKSIGELAFEGAGLKAIRIPASVETIEGDASLGPGLFTECENLESIDVDVRNKKFRSVDGVLFEGNTLLRYPAAKADRAYTVPDGTVQIAYGAFEDARALTSLSVPASVKKIEAMAFNNCSSLQNATLAEGITKVSSTAFAYGTALTSLVIPASVTDFTSNVYCGDNTPDTHSLTFYLVGTTAPKFDAAVCGFKATGYKTIICYPENATGWDAVQQQEDVKRNAHCFEFRTGTPPTEPSEPTDELKPPVLQVSSDSVYEGGSVILSWNQISNASAYILKTVDPEGNESEKTLMPEKTTTSSVNLSLGTYRFSIAVRTRDRETSDFSDVVVVEVIKKSAPTHDFYWDYMYGFGNNTSGMSEGYYLSARDHASLLLGSSPLSKLTIELFMAADRAEGWSGSCQGFAVSSFLFLHDKLSIAKYANDKSVKTVRQLPNTKTVQSLINYYYFQQNSTEELPRQLLTYARGNDKNLKLLIDYLNSTDKAAVILGFRYTDKDGNYGHTVVAYGATEQKDDGYQFAGNRYKNRIRLYDSNEYGSTPNDYDGTAYLYYNINSDGTYEWAIGGYGTAKSSKLVIQDINYSLDSVDYNNIEDMKPWILKNAPPILANADDAQKYMFILAQNKSNSVYN